jgi:hypothetical protein
MARRLQGPRVNIARQVVPISKGGTGTDNLPDASENLKLVTTSMVNQNDGVIGLDATGKVPSSRFALNNRVSIDGMLAVIAGQSLVLQITDFDSFKNYVITASHGTVTRNGAVITYQSPNTVQPVTLTINGKVYNISVQLAAPLQPSITSPVANAAIVTTSYLLTGSVFSQFGDSSTHATSDWQVATDSDFSTIVANSIDNAVNLTSYSVTGLVDGLTYYARVRYKASNGNYSQYSDTAIFSVAVPTPITPTITSPLNNAISVALSPTLTSSVFGALADGSTHASSTWEISTNPSFTNIVKSVVNSVTDRTSWNTSGLASTTIHYARVRYTSSNGKTSANSPIILFTTTNRIVATITIAANINNYVLNTAKVPGYIAGITDVTLVVNSGIVVGSTSTATAGLITDTSWAGTDTVTIVNNGTISGRGGQGGGGSMTNYGNGNDVNGYPGNSGGPGLRVQFPTTINNLGTIQGGGGGGGGGGLANSYEGSPYAGWGGGGGGGAGAVAGSGTLIQGNAEYWSAAGATGTLTTGGAGTNICFVQGNGAGAQAHGQGGNGGAPGQTGTAGQAGLIGPRPGGAGGAAVIGNSMINWITNGTRLGAIT